MHAHFSQIASTYNDLRTTDADPVYFIRDELEGIAPVYGADMGCGSGRYDLLLLRHIPKLRLKCFDINENMVKEATSYLASHGARNVSVEIASATTVTATAEIDFVSAFNSIHHFKPVPFLKRVTKLLKHNGFIFVYTRLRSQNLDTIWGRFFPGFLDKEDRLYDLHEIQSWLDSVDNLDLQTVRFFNYKRSASLERLMQLARAKHYSTFALYGAIDFQQAMVDFEKNLMDNYADPKSISWTDANVLTVFRKR